MTIIIDNRERNSKLPELLERTGISIKYDTLEVGDYILQGVENVLIERKDVGDFLQSLISNHLNNQLFNMSVNFPYSFLLIEGQIGQELFNRRIKRQTYFSSVAGSALKRAQKGNEGIVFPIMVENIWDSQLFIEALYRKIQTEEGFIRLPKLERHKLSKDDRLVSCLMGIEGIGETTSRALLSKFRTLKAFSNCTRGELLEVSGIGERTASKILETLEMIYEGEKE